MQTCVSPHSMCNCTQTSFLVYTQALAHPWFSKMLKKSPPVNGSNNVVPLQKSAGRRQQRQQLQPVAPAAATVQQSVARVGRSYPSPTAVASFAF